MTQPRIFLCHSHKDKRFVRKLAKDLEKASLHVWVDEAELLIGDSLIDKISKAINDLDLVVVVLSKNSVKSNWVQKELEMAMTKETENRTIVVLPILKDDCQNDLPLFIKAKLWGDCRGQKYKACLEHLIKSIHGHLGDFSASKQSNGGQILDATVSQKIDETSALIPGQVSLGKQILGAQVSYFESGKIQLTGITLPNTIAEEIAKLKGQVTGFQDGTRARTGYKVEVLSVQVRQIHNTAQLTIWLKIEPLTIEIRSLTHVVTTNETMFRLQCVLHNNMTHDTTVTDIELEIKDNTEWHTCKTTESLIQWDIGAKRSKVNHPLFILLNKRLDLQTIQCKIRSIHTNGDTCIPFTSNKVDVHANQRWKIF